jgi:hypothetical protein
MSDRDKKKDEMGDRLGARFDDDDNQDNRDDRDNQEQQNKPDKLSPKDDWVGRMVYVPGNDDSNVDNLLSAFDGEYDRMQYETDWKVKKQRHYYPVLVQVGVERLQDMDGDDFTQVAEEIGIR